MSSLTIISLFRRLMNFSIYDPAESMRWKYCFVQKRQTKCWTSSWTRNKTENIILPSNTTKLLLHLEWECMWFWMLAVWGQHREDEVRIVTPPHGFHLPGPEAKAKWCMRCVCLSLFCFPRALGILALSIFFFFF